MKDAETSEVIYGFLECYTVNHEGRNHTYVRLDQILTIRKLSENKCVITTKEGFYLVNLDFESIAHEIHAFRSQISKHYSSEQGS